MKYTLLLLCFVFVLFGSSHGYQMFQGKIPNGDKVPNPCVTGSTWQGVGHLAMGGGGARNQFGIDFYDNGKKWDKCLCMTDSDGDGKTNGEELGDPACTWTSSSSPQGTSGLSHPGVCEPLDDPLCVQKNQAFGNVCDPSDDQANAGHDDHNHSHGLDCSHLYPKRNTASTYTTPVYLLVAMFYCTAQIF